MSKAKPKLEPTVAVPNGAVAPRCQRVKRDGRQCAKAARVGYDVCGVHGAGYGKREREGSRKPPGRPPTHGLYSKTQLTSVAALRAEVTALQTDLDNTDEEMTTLRSVLWFLLNQAERFGAKADLVEVALTEIERVLEKAVVVKEGQPTGAGELTVAQARQLGVQLAAGHRLLSEIDSFTTKLLESNVKYVLAVKARAETATKLSEKKALDSFLKLAQLNRNLIWEIISDNATLDLYEARLKAELFTPNRLEAPKDPHTKPEELH